MSEQKPASTGLSDNVAGALCYVLWWITGIIFLILEPNNKTIRFHAFRSIILFGAIFIIAFIFVWVPFLNWLLWLAGFILWFVLILMTYQNREIKIPIADELAKKLAG
jgi:uncharacterized membrane protein